MESLKNCLDFSYHTDLAITSANRSEHLGYLIDSTFTGFGLQHLRLEAWYSWRPRCDKHRLPLGGSKHLSCMAPHIQVCALCFT